MVSGLISTWITTWAEIVRNQLEIHSDGSFEIKNPYTTAEQFQQMWDVLQKTWDILYKGLWWEGILGILGLLLLVFIKISIERYLDHKRREKAEREKAKIRSEEMKNPDNQK